MSKHRERGAGHRARRAYVLRRDCYRCQACGKVGQRLECDHVIPLDAGGADHVDNMQALCRDCHHAKTRKENGLDMPALNDWAEYATASRFKKARPG